jgi:hypothetical protein
VWLGSAEANDSTFLFFGGVLRMSLLQSTYFALFGVGEVFAVL